VPVTKKRLEHTIGAAAFALISFTANAQAATVDGVFSGTIYNSSGNAVNLPINGTFEYDTASYAYLPSSTSFNSLFAPTSPSAMSITETSALGTYVFTFSSSETLSIERDQINFGAQQAASSPNYTSIDVLFPSPIFALANLPQTFSASLSPYQGSSDTYVDGNAYDFYVSNISASPAPLPAALPLFVTVLAGLGGVDWLRRRRTT
jgi:hypothetical protein